MREGAAAVVMVGGAEGEGEEQNLCDVFEKRHSKKFSDDLEFCRVEYGSKRRTRSDLWNNISGLSK
jgi:hypothetical protein